MFWIESRVDRFQVGQGSEHQPGGDHDQKRKGDLETDQEIVQTQAQQAYSRRFPAQSRHERRTNGLDRRQEGEDEATRQGDKNRETDYVSGNREALDRHVLRKLEMLQDRQTRLRQ